MPVHQVSEGSPHRGGIFDLLVALDEKSLCHFRSIVVVYRDKTVHDKTELDKTLD